MLSLTSREWCDQICIFQNLLWWQDLLDEGLDGWGSTWRRCRQRRDGFSLGRQLGGEKWMDSRNQGSPRPVPIPEISSPPVSWWSEEIPSAAETLNHGRMQLQVGFSPRLLREPALGLVPCSPAHAQTFDPTAGDLVDGGHVAQWPDSRPGVRRPRHSARLRLFFCLPLYPSTLMLGHLWSAC